MNWKLKKYPMYYGEVRQPYLSKSAAVGNLIFLSAFDGVNLETGKVPSDKFEEQMVVCLDNIRLTLEEAGSSMDNLVKNHVFVKNFEDCPRMWKTMLEYYQKHAPQLVEEPPAITVSEINPLSRPECLVEIDSVAVIPTNELGWEVKKYPMYYGGVKQVYPNIEPGMPFLSESVAVGNLLFLSGMGGENPDTGTIETNVFEEQMDLAFDKIRMAMNKAGSSLSNIIKTLHLQTRLKELLVEGKEKGAAYNPASDRLWKSELWYYDKHAPYLLDEPPTSTFMKVSSLANPEALVSIDITGVISRFHRPGWEVKKYPSYMAKRGFPRHIGDIVKYYANTVVVGNLIFVSGQPGWDLSTGRIETDDFEEQMVTALDNLKFAMEQSGSSLENLVKTHILLPNAASYTRMREIEREYYQKYAPKLVDEPPASTCIHLFNLYSPKCLVEVDAIGFLPSC